MSIAYWLNTAWMCKCRREAHLFHRATSAVAETQSAVLQTIIAANRHTQFGRRHGFGSIETPSQFQERVPLSTYDSYQQSIDRIAAGEPNVLTTEKVELLEPTSGTTNGTKLIPYTRSLRRQFQRALAGWIWDLMRHRPAVRHGSAYWSISPALGPQRRTPAGIPIGFDDDTAYLGLIERFAVNSLLAVPPSVAKLSDIDNFRYSTLLHLVQSDDLALISIWNPTFLTALLRQLDEWCDRLSCDLHRGSISLPNPARDGAKTVSLRPRPNSRRADEIKQILRSQVNPAEILRTLWPNLALISCWADGAAAMFLPQLRELFPTIEIQPKGLLATEGCVSLPLVGQPGAVLALRSHFFEFEECTGADSDGNGACRFAWQLDPGGRYRIILTTGGGLYRYQLHDVVEVVGFLNQCPLLRFVARSGGVSDLVGEKLSEAHVGTILDRVFTAHRLAPTFAMLAPAEEFPPRYLLFLQDRQLQQTPALARSIEAAVESGLHENPHYRYAVELEQLQPMQLRLLSPRVPGWSIYNSRCRMSGQKEGGIKPKALDSGTGWAHVFAEAEAA